MVSWWLIGTDLAFVVASAAVLARMLRRKFRNEPPKRFRGPGLPA